MNQLLDPFIALLTADERRSYRNRFIAAVAGMLSIVAALFLLIALMVNLQLVGFLIGSLLLAGSIILTLRLIRRKDANESRLLQETQLRFGDSLFLQHGLIPGTKPPVLDRRARYFTDDNSEVYGIASLESDGTISLARY